MTRLSAFTAAVAVLTFAVPVFAQQGGTDNGKRFQGQQRGRGETQLSEQDRGRGMPRGGRGGQGGGGLFRLLDVDRDGMLSTTEIDRAIETLMKLDVNRDGVLSAQELVIRGGGRRGQKGSDDAMKSRNGANAQKGTRQ